MVGNKITNKIKIILLFGVVLLNGCSKYWDFIPKQSSQYTIEGKKIRFLNTDIDLTISGVYTVSDRYLASFDIMVNSLQDTINASFSSVDFIADSISRKIRIIKFLSNDIDANEKKVFFSNSETNCTLRLEVLQSNISKAEDAFSEILVDFNSVFSIKGTSMPLPKFSFIAEKPKKD